LCSQICLQCRLSSSRAFDAAFDGLIPDEDYDRQQKVREAAKASRESKLSRSEKQAQAAAKEASSKKFAETMDAVRQFNEAQGKEKEPPPPSGSK
jgi:hypothetical protein